VDDDPGECAGKLALGIGAPQADDVDWLVVIANWVQNGEAPNRICGTVSAN
jgi:hypothetical protein